MSDLVTDATVEAAAKLLDPDAWEMSAGDYQDAHGRSYGNAESFIRSARATARNAARRVLRVAAPAIAAKALRDAAEVWQTGGWADDIPRGATRPAVVLGMAQRATNWLRARADRTERGES